MSAASAFAKENFKAALDRCAQILDGHPLLEPTGDRPKFFASWKIHLFEVRKPNISEKNLVDLCIITEYA